MKSTWKRMDSLAVCLSAAWTSCDKLHLSLSFGLSSSMWSAKEAPAWPTPIELQLLSCVDFGNSQDLRRRRRYSIAPFALDSF